MKDTNKPIKPVCVIVYKEDNTIEGVIETEKDFKKWLSEHNKGRKELGEVKESADEFEVIKTILFTY
jgi:hypothetical protein